MAVCRCPNCKYVGEPKKKIKTSNTVTAAILVIVSLFFPMLFLISIPALLVVPFLPRDVLCIKCKWAHVVPLGEDKNIIEQASEAMAKSEEVSTAVVIITISIVIAVFVYMGVNALN